MSAALQPLVSSQRPAVAEVLALADRANSIAVLGASSDPGKLGHLLLKVLTDSGYAGRIIPINRRAESILGHSAFPSLADVTGEIDTVIVALPSDQLIDAMRQCAERGVRLVAAITSGFSEAGAAGEALQAELLEILQTAPFRLLGPNCEGFVIPGSKAFVTFSLMTMGLRDGPVAIVSQSGAMAGAMAQRLKNIGVGVRALVTTGNEADISAVDVLEWLADDAKTSTILAYLEEIRDGERFTAVAKRLMQRKAIIIEKTGRGQAASAAVLTHTGAIAGDAKVVDGVFEQLNIVNVRDFGHGVDAAVALSLRKSMEGLSVGVVSIAGGLAVETTDLLESSGFIVPEFKSELQQSIRKRLPYFAAARNPVDLTGVALSRPELFEGILGDVLKDDRINAVIVIITFSSNAEFASMLMRLAAASPKPLLVVWTAPDVLTPEPLHAFREQGFPIFDEPVRAVRGLSAIARYSGLL